MSSLELWGVIKFQVILKKGESVVEFKPNGYAIGKLVSDDSFIDLLTGKEFSNVECFAGNIIKSNMMYFGFPVSTKVLIGSVSIDLEKDPGQLLVDFSEYMKNYLELIEKRNFHGIYSNKDGVKSASFYSFSSDDNDCRTENFKLEFCENKQSNEQIASNNYAPISIRQRVVKEIKEKIIGQDNQIDVIVDAVLSNQKYSCFEGLKSNILMIGQTGSGKTAIARELSKLLDIPMIRVDATKFTCSGYKGRDVTSMLRDLYVKSGRDIEKTEKGIIVLDEFDKLGQDSSDKSVRTTDVQEELLGIIEGGEYPISLNGKFDDLMIDTTQITFILSGAFQELIDQLNESKQIIGFASSTEKNGNTRITREDLRKKGGIIKELLGRLPVIVQMNPIDSAVMKEILTTSKISNLKLWQRAFLEKDNVILKYTDKAIDMIVGKALDEGVGARSLTPVINSIISPIRTDISDGMLKDCEITITEETVSGAKKYIKTKIEVENGLSEANG